MQVGLRSQLTIPFRVGDTVLGGIGFACFDQPRAWPDELVQSLQLIAEVFANAQARQRSDSMRRDSEARLRFLLESTHAIPWVADAQTWRFTYVGPQATELLGYPPEAWLEKDFWLEHIHPEDRRAAVAFCAEHSPTHKDYAFDYRMLAADGRSVWIHDVVNVVTENGAPKLLRGFMIDVTQRRRAEEEARSLREQLTRAGRIMVVGELAASIAHEVNQPLCAIVSNALAAQNLLADGDEAEAIEALRDILQDGQRASGVIARIRGLLQKAPEQRTPVDLNDLIRGVVVLVRHDMLRRGVSLKLELSEDLPRVVGDRVQLQQVILNLLTNGADAVERCEPARRELVIHSSGDADAATVAVSDAGIGVDPSDSERIFDPFFSTKADGMGMGLAICKSILAAHGGRIWASANAERGTTLHFRLPRLRP
jgi:PAS domain S-box-containing protein